MIDYSCTCRVYPTSHVVRRSGARQPTPPPRETGRAGPVRRRRAHLVASL